MRASVFLLIPPFNPSSIELLEAGLLVFAVLVVGPLECIANIAAQHCETCPIWALTAPAREIIKCRAVV